MPAPAELGERVLNVGRGVSSTPRLSVVTPFHRHDPSAMLARMASAPDGVEFVLLDDGSASAALLSSVISAATRLAAPVRIVVWGSNRGRAPARNRLIEESRGDYVLFLDADMLPDTDNFLARWLDVVDSQDPMAAFGGLSVRHAEATPDTALHYNLFARSDCRDARARTKAPSQFTASANLMVRRDVLIAHPFDDAYVGWGFEDVDWALRVSRVTEILHIDNPATHAGLDDVDTLLRKSREAGPNFARLARQHPEAVEAFAAHRVARGLQQAPAKAALRAMFAWLSRAASAPLGVRRVALKLYRASHYAEHLA